jgi:hypothetical protein
LTGYIEWQGKRYDITLPQLKQQVSAKAKELGPGEWITGGGRDEYHYAANQ